MRIAAPLLLALVLGGCAAPRPALFAVLPAPDGHIGAIVVHGPDGPRVVNTAYGAQRLDAEGRLSPEKLTRAQVQDAFGTTLAALPPAPATFTLYFREGSDEFTAESRAELDKVLNALKGRPLPDILVIGHTDTVGGNDYNDKLSLARAERAREVLVDMGLRGQRIDVAGRGKRELLVPTDENVPEPRNRRVEINVR